jgi:hypothetical protein
MFFHQQTSSSTLAILEIYRDMVSLKKALKYQQVFGTRMKSQTQSTLPFVTRKKLTDLSKKFDLVRKVQISLFECHRPLPPETDFQLTFRRGASPFCLVGSIPSTSTESTTKATDSNVFPYKLQISKCSLFIRKMILNENIALLSSGKKFIYPCKHIDIKAFAIPSSTTEYISEIIYSTTIPQFLAVGLVTTALICTCLATTRYFKVYPIQLLEAVSNGKTT